MSRELLYGLMQDALKASDADQAEIVAMKSNSALTWYAENIIHQNVAEHTAQVQVRAVVGKKVGSASTTDCSPEGLTLVVQQASQAARLMPDDPDFPGLPPPSLPVGTPATVGGWVAATAASEPRERVLAVKKIIERAERDDLRAAGTYQVQDSELAVVSSMGVSAYHQYTVAVLKAVVMGDDSSGYGLMSSADVADIDPEAVGEQAVRTAVETRHPIEVEPGAFDVVLSPFAVEELMGMLAYLALSARSVEEHTCFLEGHEGEQLASPIVSLYDDGLDPSGMPIPFDFEGMPKRRVDFLTEGRGGNVVYDSYYAAKMGRATTGHSLQQPNDMGPYPLNIFMGAGDSSEADMVSHVERGIYVTRFWYGNPVEPRRAVVTGTTRDGTYLIEDGRKTRGLQNMRFTQGLVDMLAHTVEISRDRAVLASAFGIGAMVLPSIRAEGFQFTGVTR
ncbi:MAG: TldD/PmbA family protein [Caldiserica bacterium]|nr:TldD/PmbA family protein [Caldisericota bacterium]MCX6085908.1 TldD/PmbA family protein [Caldisericota bacterium]